MAEDIAVLDGALPLVRGDNPWATVMAFKSDADTPDDLSGHTVVAEMRWGGRGPGSQAVTATITDAPAGIVELSLTKAQTLALPLGRLVTLYVQLREGATEKTRVAAAIDVKEGLNT
jgi:hypothetical protein